MTSVDGLVSGIKSGDIITAMVNADRASTKVLEDRKAEFQTQLDTVRGLTTKLLSAQLDVNALRRPATFQARIATSSNTAALTATAATTAKPASYQFDVVQTAQAHQVATTRQTSDTYNFGAGAFTIQVGNGAQKTITLTDPAKTSLNDIADAITQAGVGVNAFVVKDNDPANPYRLVMQSTQSGGANTIAVTGVSGGLTGVLDQSTFSTLAVARDAQIRLGSGAGAALFSSSTNTFGSIVPGVTLTAQAPGNSINVTVGTDTAAAQKQIVAMVDSFNAAVKYFNDNATYDPTTKKGGVLLAESDLRRAVDGLRATLTGQIGGLPTNLNTLSAIGITVDKGTGQLVVDSDKLSTRLAADPDGVQRLFGNSATSSDTRVQFLALTDQTKVTNPFSVNVTQAAAQALSTGGNALANPTVIDGTNDTFGLTINGEAVSVTLAHRTDYTPQQLADHLQQSINAAVKGQGNKVAVSVNAGGQIEMRSQLYGSAQKITVDTTSSANAVFGFAAGQSAGQDVIASIDGGAAITGVGQVLTGATGTSAEGLRLLVTSTDPVLATVSARKGVAQLGSERLLALTKASGGSVTAKEDGLQGRIDALGKQITANDTRLEQRRARYEKMFQQMETLINQYQSQGNFLTSQIKGFENAAAAK